MSKASFHLICLLMNRNDNRSDRTGFSRSLVFRLIEALEGHPLPRLTPNEHAHLLVLIQTTLEVRMFVIATFFF